MNDTIDLVAELTLEPGVVLSFGENTGLISQDDTSGFIALGTSAEPILLTGEVKTGGSWNGVYLRQAREEGNRMDYVTIEYGGGVASWVSSDKYNLSVGQSATDVAQVDVTNSTFRHAGVPGSDGDAPQLRCCIRSVKDACSVSAEQAKKIVNAMAAPGAPLDACSVIHVCSF